MKPNDKPAADPQARVRQLVARYTDQGPGALASMTAVERLLLLSAKQLHLGMVADRCERGEGLHVNVPLKRLLERDVKEIGQSLQPRQPDRELELER
jgi:hypothetical protein